MAYGALDTGAGLRCRHDTRALDCYRKDTYNQNKPKFYLPPTAQK
jgi:hypothetical protein